MARSNVVVGAHVLCFINGILVGEAMSVDWSVTTENQEKRGIDSIMAYELAPTMAKVEGSVSLLRMHGTGGLEGRGIVAPFTHIPQEKYFSILLIDRGNGKTLHQADYCKVQRQSWNMAAKRLVTGQFSFIGIDNSNEITDQYR